MATALDRALIGDEGLIPTSHKGLTYPFGDRSPQPGELLTVMPGIRWWRVPMSGPLKHVNGLILDDGDGALAIDTGTAGERSVEAWRTILDTAMGGQRISRVLCTHMHPDHVGLAGWLCRKFDAPLLMTRTEWLTVRMLAADARDETPDEMVAFWRASGWDAAQLALGAGRGWSHFGKMISRMPLGFTRIQDGQTLKIGGSDWQVIVGSGHSPEHACLLDRDRKVLIAGDQVLPKISSNVSLGVMEPDGDPLGDWLSSIAKLKQLPPDLLVLPGHGDPFYGLHTRLDALDHEHRDRLDALVEHMADGPKRAIDCFGRLFRRAIGPDVIGMATGEAMAHLRHLEVEGRAVKEISDGVWWYRRV